MNGILFGVTVLLAIADRLLVTYGTCRLTLTEGEEGREVDVEGGQTLLSYLIDNEVNISSSCGGKGSCGYCKVRLLSGGGPVLPTEEIYMSRQEKQEGVRLACQVKVKNDMEIFIPDFLDIVKAMVASQKFDAKKRWRVTIK
jgi:Na+-transporting NADH:ubiquinone oxidoreductase subunit F